MRRFVERAAAVFYPIGDSVNQMGRRHLRQTEPCVTGGGIAQQRFAARLSAKDRLQSESSSKRIRQIGYR
jgi:hypothetical protein